MAETVTLNSTPLLISDPWRSAGPGGNSTKTNGKQPRYLEETSKRRQAKSRNGCSTCKAKRMKCDETKPACQQCLRRKVKCGGYKKDLRWIQFGQPRNAGGQVDDDTQGLEEEQEAPGQPADAPQEPADEEDDTTLNRTKQKPTLRRLRKSRPPSAEPAPVPSPPIEEVLPVGEPEEQDPATAMDITAENMFEDFDIDMDFFDPTQPLEFTAQSQLALNFSPKPVNLDFFALAADREPRPQKHQPSPHLFDLLLLDNDPDSNLPGPFHWQGEDDGQIYGPLQDPMTGIGEALSGPLEDFDSRQKISLEASPLSTASTGSSEAHNMYSMYQQPGVATCTPDIIRHLFKHQTCKILSIKDTPSENPWRKLIWPLAKESPTLYRAFAAMTCLHMGKTQPLLQLQGVEHLRSSTRALSANAKSGKMPLDAALAATLALGFAETWDFQKTSTGIQYIKDARPLLQQAIIKHKTTRLSNAELARLIFLANTWMYMDVIARLTSTDNISNDSELIAACSALSLGFREQPIDTLMGCAHTLFPTLGRVADLVAKVRRREAKRNSPVIIAQASELKRAVENWAPPIDMEKLQNPTSDISDSVQTAEAYRWATLILLRQAVPELPCLLSFWDIAEKIMIYLATIPLTSRTIIVHIFPLLAAGCEAVEDEDRQWIRDRWDQMSERMITGILDRCKEVTEEAWRRRDEFENSRCAFCMKPRYIRQSSSPSAPLEATFDIMQDSLNAAGPGAEGGNASFSSCKCGSGGGGTSSPGSSLVSDFPESVAFKKGADPLTRSGYMEYTVKGKLHWLGIMREWNWEVMLG